MCFSAEMSFGAGAVLTTVGIMSIRKAKPKSNQLYVALIPLFFGIQQITEGFIWVIHSIDKYNFLLPYLNLFYLFFATILWPIWIPLSVLKLKGNTNEIITKFSLGLGVLVSLYLGQRLFSHEVSSEILCYHIKYHVSHINFFKTNYPILGTLYLATISLPTFFHSSNYIRIFGILMVVSYFMSKWIYANYFTSVWCFLAAIISIFVYYSLSKINSKTKTNYIC